MVRPGKPRSEEDIRREWEDGLAALHRKYPHPEMQFDDDLAEAHLRMCDSVKEALDELDLDLAAVWECVSDRELGVRACSAMARAWMDGCEGTEGFDPDEELETLGIGRTKGTG